MNEIDKAVAFMLKIAGDERHGYDQANRWGPDYDCSSLVISAWHEAGVPVKTKGATYTGNMKKVFLANGFTDVTASCNLLTATGMVKGDVLLNEKKHTAMYIGNKQIVHARGNENGGAIGGKTGDQTNGEIRTQAYYNSPWDCVLRYGGTAQASVLPTATTETCTVTLPELRRGMSGNAVKAMQALLILRGYSVGYKGADGEFGAATLATLRLYQAKNALTVDGECGKETWTKLIGG